jgi:hypothetical protein
MTPFQNVSDDDLLKATLFHRCYLSDTGCWVWKKVLRNGYGLFYKGKKNESAHRVSYRVFKGPIPEGLILRHTCDNPSCINPDHLIPGTMKENAHDRDSRGRRDVRGTQIGTSKLTPEQAFLIKITDIPIKIFAHLFGVKQEPLYRIRSGESWAHLNASAMWAHLSRQEGEDCGN